MPVGDQTTLLSDPHDKSSPRLGKVSHPCGAPDGHLLTVYTPGMVPDVLKPNQARLIKAGSDIVLQIHYTSTKKDTGPVTREERQGLVRVNCCTSRYPVRNPASE